MTTITGGHLVARALKAEGIEAIFTLCGGHIIDIYDGCTDAGIRIIDVRHEQAAAHAADAWTRLTGIAGCAVVTAGPGTTDTVTAVANAWRAQTPMLVIGGQGPLKQAYMGSLQELDHVNLMKPITKFAATVYQTERIPELIGMALRQAYSGRPGPVFVEIPADVLFNAVPESEVVNPGTYRSPWRIGGDPAAIDRAGGPPRSCGAPRHPGGQSSVALPGRRRAAAVRGGSGGPRLPQRSGPRLPAARSRASLQPLASRGPRSCRQGDGHRHAVRLPSRLRQAPRRRRRHHPGRSRLRRNRAQPRRGPGHHRRRPPGAGSSCTDAAARAGRNRVGPGWSTSVPQRRKPWKKTCPF